MDENLTHQTTPLAKLLAPLGRSLTPEVARALIHLRADSAVQERLDELADKSTEGTLTNDERAEYEIYIHAIDFISVLQTQARRLLKNIPTTDTA
jgi:uncharacterized protein YnzC (UPF0291/DUF896 family)